MTKKPTQSRRQKTASQNHSSFTPHPKIQGNEQFLMFHFMEWVGSHLCDCSRVFKGDLIEMTVLAVIGQMFVRYHNNEATRNYALDGEVLTISIAQISEATSIPRETVRRKLLLLQKRGWVEQMDNGGWTMKIVDGQSNANKDLQTLQMRSLTRLMNLVDAVSSHIHG